MKQSKEQLAVTEGNKLIAVFMGMRFLSTHIDSHNYEQYSYSMPDELSKQVYGYTGATCFLSDEQFYTSWDWLMPVWERFRYLVWNSIGYTPEFIKWKKRFMEDVFNGCCFSAANTMVGAIQWYNNQNLNQ